MTWFVPSSWATRFRQRLSGSAETSADRGAPSVETPTSATTMARGDLIAPVRAAEAGRRRRAAGFAVLSGALLAVLGSVLAAVRGGEHSRPGALAPSGASAMGAVHEAQSAAQGAVQNVATFLAALKAQKVEHPHTRTPTHARRTHTRTHTHACTAHTRTHTRTQIAYAHIALLEHT